MNALSHRDVETYWTGVHGDVVVETDGSEITVESEHNDSTDPADLLDEKPSDQMIRAIATPRLDRTHHPAVA